MGLFEILFERKNPGSVGSIEKNKHQNEHNEHINVPILIIRMLLSLFIIYILLYLAVLNNYSLPRLIIFTILLFLYCFISYKYIPRPDNSNVGLLGGLFDHPFRYSDDINRMLIGLLILLYPGRFISTTFVQIILLFKQIGRKK